MQLSKWTLSLSLGVVCIAGRAHAEAPKHSTQDPQPAVASPARATPLTTLSYTQAIARATADTPRMAAARASVLRAEAQVDKSRAPWLPTLNGVANYSRLDDDRTINNRITQPANSFNLSAQLFVPIVVPARWVDTARQEDALAATKSNAKDAQRLAIVDVTRAYLAVELEKQALDIAQRALATSQRQAEIMTQRKQEGVASRLEEVRAEREVHTNGANVAARRSALRVAQEGLGVATFIDGPVDTQGSITVGNLPALPAALHSAEQRSDLVALRRQVSAAQERVDDAWLDYMPTLNAQGQVFYQNPETVNFPQLGWQASLILVLPLYDGGKRAGDQREREANHLESASGLRAAELRAQADVRATAAEAENRYAAWVETQTSVTLSRESLDLARLAFSEGTGTQLDLIEAERSTRDAETNAVIAQTAFLQAQLLYRLAAGHI